MAFEDILTFLSAQLSSLDGSGTVLPYDPTVIGPERILGLFGGNQNVNFWSITLNERAPKQEHRQSNVEVWRSLTFRMSLYQSVTDPLLSEITCRELSEAAMALFRPTIRIAEPYNIDHSDPLQCTDFVHVIVGKTMLCHLARHTLTLYELILLDSPTFTV